MLGGWCFYGLYCGVSHVALDVSPEHVKWDVGACDHLALNSGYVEFLWGVGGCFDEGPGVGMHARNDFVSNDRVYWIGACLL